LHRRGNFQTGGKESLRLITEQKAKAFCFLFAGKNGRKVNIWMMGAGEFCKQTPKEQVANRSESAMNLSGKRTVSGHNSEKQQDCTEGANLFMMMKSGISQVKEQRRR
jgi:hypothetical protein